MNFFSFRRRNFYSK